MLRFISNTIKAPHRYVVEGSDTTMMTRAASLFGQKYFVLKTTRKKGCKAIIH